MSFFGGSDDSLLFFFLLLVIIFCNCGFFDEGSELLFFFLLLVVLFMGEDVPFSQIMDNKKPLSFWKEGFYIFIIAVLK